MISLVIPTLNEEKNIKESLLSLREQTYKDFEIIIADGGSKDKTVEIARKYADKVVVYKGSGISEAKNRGVREAKGEILVFTDADTKFENYWLERIAKHFEDKEVVAVGGPVKPLEDKFKHRFMFKLTTDYAARIMKLFNFNAFIGSNCAYRKKQFLKVGGFDEKIKYLEDNELPNRVRKLGKVVFDPSIFVYTSARRYEEGGYVKETLRFWKAYLNLYILKKGVEEEYKLYH
jgi:glycosyltransferase involved in cell wall biosynthesis